nr:solute carrier family 23 member 2-like [Zonotrichia albicollis]
MQVLDVLDTMGIGKNTTAKSVEAGGGSTEGKYEDESKHPTFFTLPVVINGGATSSGDQDTEDTELMAIYTTENGIAEKHAFVPAALGERSLVRSPGVARSCSRVVVW